ncbi:MAG: hypothetical protein ACSHW7_15200 [Patiriisocius sp.]|uniref:hypothetical protein n=1 Tax=Patiriisocius sp. TaxID=2822396 RepID=UPI003EF57DCD
MDFNFLWNIFLFAGLLMLVQPERARNTIAKAGSTSFINYAEITVRLIPAIALIMYADYSKFPLIFIIIGWFMALTSLILYIVPRKIHHAFSTKSARLLKPLYLRLLSPFALLLGIALLYSILSF